MIYETMQRDGFCRGCDTALYRNVDMAIKFYSHRNRGQSILLCTDCVRKMSSIIDNYRMDKMFEDDGWIRGNE